MAPLVAVQPAGRSNRVVYVPGRRRFAVAEFPARASAAFRSSVEARLRVSRGRQRRTWSRTGWRAASLPPPACHAALRQVDGGGHVADLAAHRPAVAERRGVRSRPGGANHDPRCPFIAASSASVFVTYTAGRRIPKRFAVLAQRDQHAVVARQPDAQRHAVPAGGVVARSA